MNGERIIGVRRDSKFRVIWVGLELSRESCADRREEGETNVMK